MVSMIVVSHPPRVNVNSRFGEKATGQGPQGSAEVRSGGAAAESENRQGIVHSPDADTHEDAEHSPDKMKLGEKITAEANEVNQELAFRAVGHVADQEDAEMEQTGSGLTTWARARGLWDR